MASFEAIPLCDASFDVVVFNASLRYAEDLARALAEAHRVVRPMVRIVVLDSPFYLSAQHGEEMLREKRQDALRHFGARAESLMALAFVEYLTRGLADASRGLGLGPVAPPSRAPGPFLIPSPPQSRLARFFHP